MDIKKISFQNDYSEGAHQNIIRAITETNYVSQQGYGEDEYCLKAKEYIKEKLENNRVDIHFISGGTQTNLIGLSVGLKPFEAIISAETGHINTHETGAIEGTGHKILTIPSPDGKITVDGIQKILDGHPDEHMVRPKTVFISNATEEGTIYKKEEMQAISKFCKENNLYLYLDGARLGSGICSKESDLELKDLPDLVDMFYIGGTKNGAMLGEALIICNDELKRNFRYYIKHKGALLAKGRFLGIQFMELFKDDLFFSLAKYANNMAEKLSNGIRKSGYDFLTDSCTNQIFPIFNNEIICEMRAKYMFHDWKVIDSNRTAIRLVTSWATKENDVENFLDDLSKYK